MTALAGCAGFLGGGGGGPAGTAKSAIQAALNGNVDQLEGFVHSESPLRPIDESSVGTGAGSSDSVNINIQNTEVVNEDPGEEAIRNQFGGFGTSQEQLDTLVQVVNNAEDAAIVDISVELTISANGQSTSTTTTATYLMATENGNWKLLAAGGSGGSAFVQG